MIAIECKFLGPTNTKGARIKASADGRSITRPYDHALGDKSFGVVACEFARTFLDWTPDDTLIEGCPPRGRVFVFAETADRYHVGSGERVG